MPPKAAKPAKKHALNLAQLSAYDDILTDALVDHVRPGAAAHCLFSLTDFFRSTIGL